MKLATFPSLLLFFLSSPDSHKRPPRALLDSRRIATCRQSLWTRWVVFGEESKVLSLISAFGFFPVCVPFHSEIYILLVACNGFNIQ